MENMATRNEAPIAPRAGKWQGRTLADGRVFEVQGHVVRHDGGGESSWEGVGIAWLAEADATAILAIGQWLEESSASTPTWAELASEGYDFCPELEVAPAPECFPLALGLRYLLPERIGQGGNGVVYRAIDVRLDRLVVLKLMSPALASDALARRYFLREIRVAASLDHPGVVQVNHADEINGLLYYVMEYVDAAPLSQHLRAGQPLGHRDLVLSIAAQLGAVLDHAHGPRPCDRCSRCCSPRIRPTAAGLAQKQSASSSRRCFAPTGAACSRPCTADGAQTPYRGGKRPIGAAKMRKADPSLRKRSAFCVTTLRLRGY